MEPSTFPTPAHRLAYRLGDLPPLSDLLQRFLSWRPDPIVLLRTSLVFAGDDLATADRKIAEALGTLAPV
jgi:hypothetical protein